MNDSVLDPSPAIAETSASVRERTPDYAIYKPNSRGSGGVIRFGINRT